MLTQAGVKRKLGLRSAGTMRVLRGAWRAMAEHSLRRGLRIVPLQLAWHYWRRGLGKAAKSVEAQRRRTLRTALAAWKRGANCADVQLKVTSLDGTDADLALSCQASQAQLHARLARLHKIAPTAFRLWWSKPDALVSTLLAAEAQTLRAAGLQSGAQIKMRLAAPVRGGMDSTKQTAVDLAEIEVKGQEESGAHI